MRLIGGTLGLSASDVSNHLACRHLTRLDREVALGQRGKPEWTDPNLALMRERGLRHERAYIEHLAGAGVDVVELPAAPGAAAVAQTVDAMRAGTGAIVQAPLADGRWEGRADLLLRVPGESRFGPWSYEAVDTKLAEDTRAGTVLQLCLYTDLLGQLQGRAPVLMHVVTPHAAFQRESFRFDDYGAYYRHVRDRLAAAVDTAAAAPYPVPVEHCESCRWARVCEARRRADDHLCLVAGIRTPHIAELERVGIRTLAELARGPLPGKPSRGSVETFEKLHEQAAIQARGRTEGRVLHELLPPAEGRGLALLPQPDPADFFFDIESDPFAGEAGREYLLGFAAGGDDGAHGYTALWSFDDAEEKRGLESFIDTVMARWEENPGMHVYHFSPYEPAAVKRLVDRHGTREKELDRLLRAERFVDLFAAVRQGLRASVESYSLKALEACYGFAREMDLPSAGMVLRRVARALELAPLAAEGEIDAGARAAVEAYNRDDCLSTAALRAWLEEQRAVLEAAGSAIPRPAEKPGDPSEAVEEMTAKVKEVFDLLTAGLPVDRAAWDAADRARWLLAHQLEYFRREEKSAWWDFYRIQALDHEELLDERKAVVGLVFDGEAGGTPKSPVHRYTFPPQEAGIEPGKTLLEIGGGEIGTLASIDPVGGVMEIQKKAGAGGRHPAAVMLRDTVRPQPVDTSLLEFARSAARGGVDGLGPCRAGRDLLLQAPPRLRSPRAGSLRRPGESAEEAAGGLAADLVEGVLPIQGPPGTGKTHTGARMILALLQQGKKVGVTAVSHKVIVNLLTNVIEAAREAGREVVPVHRARAASPGGADGIEEITDNRKAHALVAAGRLTGATCWFWSREEAAQSLDYLFIDEAGQMSLAYTLAASRAARNLVLLGDPQQLEQPQRGVHPEGADVAALVHALRGRKTLPDDCGLFFDETWRLSPGICAFTSELYYERRLRPRPGLEKQALAGTPFAGSGLFYVPVDHEGRQSSSPEEVEAVARIVAALLRDGSTWTDADGATHAMTADDILVVAPYNAQVAALSQRLPALHVGTVDRFQGQQAPVVIYSMTSSSAADAPRGMSFLYSPNRLNVATSRARCACILVAARRALEPECRTPEQMLWANGLCRYREMAREVAV
jgi:predicted RecB family nuclease